MISKIMKNLYIGPADDVKYLRPFDRPVVKVKAIINVASGEVETAVDGVEYHKFYLVDKNIDQTAIIKKASKMVRDYVVDGVPVYVHCVAGISRSSIVCICALHLFGMSWHESVKTVQDRHPPSRLLNLGLLNTTMKRWKEVKV